MRVERSGLLVQRVYQQCPHTNDLRSRHRADDGVAQQLRAQPLALFLAVMMLVNLPMFSLKFSSLGWKGNEERYTFAAVSLILLIIFRIAALPMIMAAYILISLLFPLAAGRRTAS